VRSSLLQHTYRPSTRLAVTSDLIRRETGLKRSHSLPGSAVVLQLDQSGPAALSSGTSYRMRWTRPAAVSPSSVRVAVSACAYLVGHSTCGQMSIGSISDSAAHPGMAVSVSSMRRLRPAGCESDRRRGWRDLAPLTSCGNARAGAEPYSEHPRSVTCGRCPGSLRSRRRLDLRYLAARLEGLEPPAGCLEGSCSIRLSYRRPHAPSAHCARLLSRLGHASAIEPEAMQNVSSVPCPGLPQARS
jgi:hypothetical protein